MSVERYELYRYFDASGNLLYIGQTVKPHARQLAHSNYAEWWSLVAWSQYETFESAEDLADAERIAIRTECPSHNVVRYVHEEIPYDRRARPSPELVRSYYLNCECAGFSECNTCRPWFA